MFFEHILLFIGRFLLFVLLLFVLLCIINSQSNTYTRNKILLLGLFCYSLISARAQVLPDKGTGKNSSPIVSPLMSIIVCLDGRDATAVRKSASLFVGDVHRATRQELKMDENKPGRISARYAIIAGTMGESGWVDALVSRNKIDMAVVAEGWERYMIEVVNNPVSGIKKAIIVAGNDRHGTAYGLSSASKAIGVSP